MALLSVELPPASGSTAAAGSGSCCREGGAGGAGGVGPRLGSAARLQSGQTPSSDESSHFLMHRAWNSWPHGSVVTVSPAAGSQRQIAHSTHSTHSAADGATAATAVASAGAPPPPSLLPRPSVAAPPVSAVASTSGGAEDDGDDGDGDDGDGDDGDGTMRDGSASIAALRACVRVSSVELTPECTPRDCRPMKVVGVGSVVHCRVSV